MALELHRSDLESERFGLRVLRAEMDELDPDLFVDAVLEQRPDVVIGRLPADKQHQLADLDRLGFPWVSADALVYYFADHQRVESTPLRNDDLTFTHATEADAGLIEDMVREIFPGYTNHYFSNPVLEKASILDGYVEWAVGYIGGPDQPKTVWLASRGGQPIAFATCRYEPQESEGVLYGVMPSEAGRGVYGDLIRYTLADSKRRGFERMLVTTQVQNFAVQAAWVRQGFVMRQASVTFHVNTLLRSSSAPALERDILIDGGIDIASQIDNEAVTARQQLTGSDGSPASTRHLALRDIEAEAHRLRFSMPDTPNQYPTTIVAQLMDGAGAIRHLSYYAMPTN